MQVFIGELAAQLGETEDQPIKLLSAVVESCGVDFARQLLQETIEIEAQGGLTIKSGARRRTVGGVFFYLARGRISHKLRKKIFGIQEPDKPKPPPPPTLPGFNWGERRGLIQPLLAESGELTTVKVTLIGRPGIIETRKDLVITTMTHAAKSPTLPKGVPPPPETPTLYTVYIAAKQWRRVEESIQDPEDALIIEGTASYDPEIPGVAVFAMSVTSKRLEQKKREAQKGGSPAESDQPAPFTPRSSQPTFRAEPPPPPPPPEPEPLLPGAPPEVNQKLAELYAAASLYRQKIASLASKPAGQQFGLEMTQKLLKNTETEINSIEQKYGGK
ncbi:MAG TPA: phosphorylated adapter RNA export RNA-binding domain-containing protein [Phototrophicaceae bacterium]|nr:phosphorylated adapter RNA export RNA-binding domain-containing protein [Phototrophicaceae bacterium]